MAYGALVGSLRPVTWVFMFPVYAASVTKLTKHVLVSSFQVALQA